MKRITLIILAVTAIIAGSVSCSKVNDINQNPLSMVALSIVPDYDDGTVKEPKTTEAMGKKSTHFYLDVAVTPAKYAEILADTERFIHKAVFSPVQTKSGFGNAFTVSPKSVAYADGSPVPYLETYFELDDETAAALQNSSYTVSYSIEDKDGVHGASTSYVLMNNPQRDKGGDVDNEDVIIINGHNAVKLASCYWATENVGECSGLLWNCPLINNDWGCCFYSEKYAKNAARIWGSENGHKWALPNNEQWQALMDDCYWEWTDSYDNPDSPDNKRSGYIVYEAKSEEDKGRHEKGTDNTYSPSDRHIFILATGLSSLADSQAYDQGTDGGYWSASSNTDFRFSNGWIILHYGGINGVPDIAFAVRLASN